MELDSEIMFKQLKVMIQLVQKNNPQKVSKFFVFAFRLMYFLNSKFIMRSMIIKADAKGIST